MADRPHRLVWVTRAQPGADATAERLIHLGLRPLVAPVLEARALAGAQVALTSVDALAFTSANGVRVFSALEARRDLPVFCVGEATAAAARQAGFTNTTSAGGDVAALATLLLKSLPTGSRVAHPCATVAAGDLGGALAGSGVSLQPQPIYETQTVETLPAAAGAALGSGMLDALLIHSPKAARAMAGLLGPLPAASLARLHVFAISQAALAPLLSCGFASATAAPAPDEATLLSLLTP